MAVGAFTATAAVVFGGSSELTHRQQKNCHTQRVMKLKFRSLLPTQRELYSLPRGRERFQAYLDAMIDPQTKDIRLPLQAMNPMGKDHIPVLLDELLRLDADGCSAQAVAKAELDLADVPGEFNVALVMSDDEKGGWTNRYAAEFSLRFESGPILKRGWLIGLLWTSESVSKLSAQEAALTAVYRAAHSHRHGQPQTLQQMLAQEGYAMAMAGCISPRLAADDISYTREVISSHLAAQDRPTIMACLFGDLAATSLGYEPKGLSAFAGLAFALHEARNSSSKIGAAKIQ